MLRSLKIYTDFNGAELEKNPNLYAVCTYELLRNNKRLSERVRIESFYTDQMLRLPSREVKPFYRFTMSHIIEDKDRNKQSEFHYAGYGYDVISILHILGDTPANREFLHQIGFHE
ncbi:hypothetical protein [Pseudomonas sp. LT1P18]|uniref:hypothetical protein n=1 Tax=Pseudomonas arabinosi TaxID=3398357 RepID=UPI0039F04DC6